MWVVRRGERPRCFSPLSSIITLQLEISPPHRSSVDKYAHSSINHHVRQDEIQIVCFVFSSNGLASTRRGGGMKRIRLNKFDGLDTDYSRTPSWGDEKSSSFVFFSSFSQLSKTFRHDDLVLWQWGRTPNCLDRWHENEKRIIFVRDKMTMINTTASEEELQIPDESITIDSEEHLQNKQLHERDRKRAGFGAEGSGKTCHSFRRCGSISC